MLGGNTTKSVYRHLCSSAMVGNRCCWLYVEVVSLFCALFHRCGELNQRSHRCNHCCAWSGLERCSSICKRSESPRKKSR